MLQVPAPDFALRKAGIYVDRTIVRLRGAIDKKQAPPKKKKGATVDTTLHTLSYSALVWPVSVWLCACASTDKLSHTT